MLLLIVILGLIFISVALAAFFIVNDRGEREPIGALWIAFGFGFAGGLVAAIIENMTIPTKSYSSASPLLIILVASLAIGVIEEACKFIPLSVFIYPKRYFNEHTDGIVYFALAGLGFGLPENILYAVQFGAATGMKRLLLTPFFHAAITGMVGFVLIKSKLDHRPRVWVTLTLLLAMALHGLYDFGLASGQNAYAIMSITITLGMSLVLFWLYVTATDLDQKTGLSSVGHNDYCRHCGQPNPEHHLYCIECGQRA